MHWSALKCGPCHISADGLTCTLEDTCSLGWGGALKSLWFGFRAEIKAARQRILDSAERPADRRLLTDMLCFTIIHCRLCSAEHLPDRKLLRMCTDLHIQVEQCFPEQFMYG